MQDQNINELKKKLFQLLKKEALKRGRFILSSGRESNYYLDGRIITLTPEGAYLTASIILEMIKGRDIVAVGGPTLGADPIVGALVILSYIKKIPITAFIVRKTPKEHGTKQRIEGPGLRKGSRVILVDDVATTGKALIESKEILNNLGVIVDSAIVVVDRNEGARKNLNQVGLRLESIFTIADFGL
ncbi:MAG: orotate phosphoribosyltransferase [Candidatus Omnitrophica bacterium]|nr:orotate phosphoribosyltransferase [Candidatus Omnitrophota bacterium]